MIKTRLSCSPGEHYRRETCAHGNAFSCIFCHCSDVASGLSCESQRFMSSEACCILPSRVINVGPGDSSQEPFIYTSNRGEVGSYLALSHCWGQSAGYVTTAMNLASGASELKLNELPFTKMPFPLLEAWDLSTYGWTLFAYFKALMPKLKQIGWSNQAA